ncbi:biotin/lipoyl-binding protein [bacterium]|nr:biotin/lipoyl-binding protein [bacterium]
MSDARYVVTVEGHQIPVVIRENEGRWLVECNGREYAIDMVRTSGTPLWSLLIDNVVHRAVLVRSAGEMVLELDGRNTRLDVATERDLLLRKFAPKKSALSGVAEVRSPMPGLVLEIEVAEGDRVEEGQGVVTVEAMKMENELKAPCAGTVTKVLVESGQPVKKDQPLVIIEADGEESGE